MLFNPAEHKSVIVIDPHLPVGLAMNAASVIGSCFGKHVSNLLGEDLHSQDGFCYPGVVTTPLPILKADTATLQKLHSQIATKQSDETTLQLIPFSALAQSCRTYEEYENRLSNAHSSALELVGLGIAGPKKLINKHTGNLPLYR